MAVGDQNDISNRLSAVIPSSWFKWPNPLYTAFIQGISAVFATNYALIIYAKAQTRMATAIGGFLDLISYDYFGLTLPRKNSESDASFLARIQEQFGVERVTLKGMITALTNLTGKAPTIIEPWNTGTCGALDVGTLALYDQNGAGGAGFIGDTNLPAQVFMIVHRQVQAGVANVAGLDSNVAGLDAGPLEITDQTMINGALTDADIYATINATRPTGVICWVALQ